MRSKKRAGGEDEKKGGQCGTGNESDAMDETDTRVEVTGVMTE